MPVWPEDWYDEAVFLALGPGLLFYLVVWVGLWWWLALGLALGLELFHLWSNG